jgi:hypothetical protein
MRARYPSDFYASDKARRLRRIKSRACPELEQAYENGQLSLRQFDMVSRGPKSQQRRLIAAEQRKTATALTAAQVIEDLLCAAKPGTPIRLSEVAAAISSAVRGVRA